jgi:hypothetical protein
MYGAFLISAKEAYGVPLKVMSSGRDSKWEHVSVSTQERCPTWDEMHLVKRLFWEDSETVMQLHPPQTNYVNRHPYCLHLWKPVTKAIPLPPIEAV